MERLSRRSAEPGLKELYAWEAERIRRIIVDYSLTEENVRSQLQEQYEHATPDKFEQWMEENLFDWRKIDGA
ncbi:MAG: hypothetical protein ACP5I1_08805, partial [Candidatus Hinthialibacter sp.]